MAQTPLTTLEASNAWPAWLVAADVIAPVAAIPTSPLLYTFHWLLFWLAGGGDSVARSLPALAGVGLVPMAWWLRSTLGRSAALLAALLIAIDPWLVAFSRLADGASLSILLGMLVLVGIWQGAGRGQEAGGKGQGAGEQWPGWLVVCAGLLLVSGTLAWSWLPVLALAWWLLRQESLTNRSDQAVESEPFLTTDGLSADQQATLQAVTVDVEDDETKNNEPADKPVASVVDVITERWPLVLFALAALLGATGWLTRLEGLGYISTSLTTWLSGITGNSGLSYPFNWPFLRLLADQPLLLVFGFLGLAQLWAKVIGPDGANDRVHNDVRTLLRAQRAPAHSAFRIFPHPLAGLGHSIGHHAGSQPVGLAYAWLAAFVGRRAAGCAPVEQTSTRRAMA